MHTFQSSFSWKVSQIISLSCFTDSSLSYSLNSRLLHSGNCKPKVWHIIKQHDLMNTILNIFPYFDLQNCSLERINTLRNGMSKLLKVEISWGACRLTPLVACTSIAWLMFSLECNNSCHEKCMLCLTV